LKTNTATKSTKESVEKDVQMEEKKKQHKGDRYIGAFGESKESPRAARNKGGVKLGKVVRKKTKTTEKKKETHTTPKNKNWGGLRKGCDYEKRDKGR